MKTCTRFTLLACALTLCLNTLFTQDLHIKPGVERWTIKTSLLDHPQNKTVPLAELLALPNPVDREDSKYDSVRIPFAVGPQQLQEGEIVTTTAWLLLVALEDDSKTHRDGDYHIQIRSSSEWQDSCLVVEVPYPEFVCDPALAAKCGTVRQFIKDRLLQGKEPGTRGNKLDHPVYVTITGQLFFDLSHLKGNLRGKRGMKSYTPWEIHPVTAIKFAPAPK
ncbi:MAG: hypothetical protein NTZ35_05965 [Ignavibacteriales bacterium]|nr:hypothetical protein [Ignavibacteriales bacterium]